MHVFARPSPKPNHSHWFSGGSVFIFHFLAALSVLWIVISGLFLSAVEKSFVDGFLTSLQGVWNVILPHDVSFVARLIYNSVTVVTAFILWMIIRRSGSTLRTVERFKLAVSILISMPLIFFVEKSAISFIDRKSRDYISRTNELENLQTSEIRIPSVKVPMDLKIAFHLQFDTQEESAFAIRFDL